MYTFLTIYSILIIVLFFTRIKWGLSLYVLLIFLVPSLPISILGIELRWNIFNLFLLFALVMHTRHLHLTISLKECKPFLWYFGFLLLFIPFEYELSYSYQLGAWLGSAFRYFVVPVTMFSIFKSHNLSGFKLLSYTIYVCIFVATVYGLFLTQTEGINPYLLLMKRDADDFIQYASPSDDRLFGRIFSVFPHPMTFGCFLVVSFFYCLYKILEKKDGYIPIILFFLIILCAITCGVRSVLVGIMLGLVVFLLLNHKINYLYYTIFLFSIILLVVFQNDIMHSYITSIFASSNSTVKGSSIEMRLVQLLGCFDIITSNPLFGNGFGWTTYYNLQKGDHPVVLAFESYIFVVLCNWGLIGLFILILFLHKIYKRCIFLVKKQVDKYAMLLSMSVAYVGYVCITGDYAYMMYWAFFYSLMYLDMTYKNEIV